MKIAVIANTSWNVYNFRKGIVTNLLAHGNQVIVIAPQDSYTSQLQSWGCDFYPIHMTATGSNPLLEIKCINEIRKITRKTKPDIFISYTIKANLYGIIVASIYHLPIICNVSGLGTAFLAKNIKTTIARSLYRLLFKKASHVFFQNRDDQEDFLRLVPLNPNRNSVIPGSGIDLNSYKPIKKVDSEKIRFLMISRLLIEKGTLEYIHAASELANEHCEFWLVGDWDPNHSQSISRDEFDLMLKKEKIQYLKHTDEIKKEIASSDVIVLPSYREGTPRTLLEGAAMGKPLITTDVPGCKEVVDDGVNGLLCEPKNADSLSSAMKRMLLMGTSNRNKMGKMSRRKAENGFDEQIIIQAYLNQILTLTRK